MRIWMKARSLHKHKAQGDLPLPGIAFLDALGWLGIGLMRLLDERVGRREREDEVFSGN